MRKGIVLLCLTQFLLWLNVSFAELSPQTGEFARKYQLALKLADNRRYQEAADVLEWILMMQPDSSLHNKALKLYKQTLLAVNGEFEQLAEMQNQNDWRLGGNFLLNFGGGSNLNRAPEDKFFEFTFFDFENPVLELEEDQQPLAGYGVESVLGLSAFKSINAADRMNLGLRFQYRHTDQRNFTDFFRVSAYGGFRRKIKKGELGFAVFADALQYDNEQRFYSMNAAARYVLNFDSDCRPLVGGDLNWRHQQDNSTFDSIFTSLMLGYDCRIDRSEVNATINMGFEWPLAGKPGGGRWRARTKLGYSRYLEELLKGSRVKAYAIGDLYWDEDGYSPIVEHYARRKTQRVLVGGEYRIPFSMKNHELWAVTKLEWQKQYSNIALFRYEALEAWIGVEVFW